MKTSSLDLTGWYRGAFGEGKLVHSIRVSKGKSAETGLITFSFYDESDIAAPERESVMAIYKVGEHFFAADTMEKNVSIFLINKHGEDGFVFSGMNPKFFRDEPERLSRYSIEFTDSGTMLVNASILMLHELLFTHGNSDLLFSPSFSYRKLSPAERTLAEKNSARRSSRQRQQQPETVKDETDDRVAAGLVLGALILGEMMSETDKVESKKTKNGKGTVCGTCKGTGKLWKYAEGQCTKCGNFNTRWHESGALPCRNCTRGIFATPGYTKERRWVHCPDCDVYIAPIEIMTGKAYAPKRD